MSENYGNTEGKKSFHSDPILAVDPPLDARKQMILKAIIEAYIYRAEPIGSKQLVEEGEWKLSSATVRKEMSELEAMGYLEQPHTSAGRVPTDKGYRAYVDELLTPVQLSRKEQAQLRAFFRERLNEVEALMRAAADALSETTGLTALVLSPRYSEQILNHLHLLLIEPGRALLVLMLSEAVVKDKRIAVHRALSRADLERIAKALETELRGEKIHEISFVMVETAAKHTAVPETLLTELVREIFETIREAEEIELYMQGQHRLLRQPEFRDPERATSTFDELHKERGLKAYLCDPLNGAAHSALMVRIGRELALEGLQDLSFVSAVYQAGPEMRGQIAVIGPRRMAYSRIISKIEFVRRVLRSDAPAESAKEEGQ